MSKGKHEDPGSFPVDRPLDALRKDHALVRTLAEAYFNSDSEEVKLRSAEQILMLLETHSLLEEVAFYPAVRKTDPKMVAHFEDAHHKTDELLAELKKSGLRNAQSFVLFEQAVAMTMDHIREEEDEFFPLLEKAGMDMTELGLQMQAYEANLVHTQARASGPGMRI